MREGPASFMQAKVVIPPTDCTESNVEVTAGDGYCSKALLSFLFHPFFFSFLLCNSVLTTW